MKNISKTHCLPTAAMVPPYRRTLIQAALLLSCHGGLLAQGLPSTPLEQSNPRPAAPASSSMNIGMPERSATSPGGAATGQRVAISRIEWIGNSVIDSATLEEFVKPAIAKALTLPELNALARQVAGYYHSRGFPFASAFVPPQKISEGLLRIEIVEGRYGKVSSGGEFLPKEADPFLAALRPGDVIEAQRLERTMLIVDDLPNIDVAPFVRPGAEYGTGNLEAVITRSAKYGGEFGLDNVGNRFTGEYRLRYGFNGYSLFRFGDEVRIKLLSSQSGTVLGSADYEAPLNGSGLRGQIGLAHTSYQLGREYDYLKANGYADVLSTRVGYPVVRSQARNLNVSLGGLYKQLRDRVEISGTDQRKKSWAFPLTASFDARDPLMGGGVTFGNVAYTQGQLSLDALQRQADASTARTNGHFHKLNMDLARIQTLPANFSLFVRAAAQHTDQNLDSSEKFAIGGFAGVRAYPTGQGVGDKGWFAQTELRQKVGGLTAFAFYDAGSSTANARPWGGNAAVRENISGSGLGVRREQLLGWTLEAVLGWRNASVLPSDNSSRGARLSATATYRY